MSFVDPKEQAAFERGLTEAGIPYKIDIRDGSRYASWEGEYSQAASQVRVSTFGEPLPIGRHVAFGPPEHQEKFKSWLREQDIPYTTRVKGGREYVIWEQAHTQKVTTWKHFGPSASEAPNPSIERTSPGKPGAASHVKR